LHCRGLLPKGENPSDTCEEFAPIALVVMILFTERGGADDSFERSHHPDRGAFRLGFLSLLL